MRYYEIYAPGEDRPACVSGIRHLVNLPVGTRIEAVVTDRDGSLIDSWPIPIVNGKPVVHQQGKHNPSYT